MGCGSSQDAQPLGVMPEAAPNKAVNENGNNKEQGKGAGAEVEVKQNGDGSKATATGSNAPSSSSTTPFKPPALPTRVGPPVPVSVLTDSYKASHFMMYPDAKKMVAYGEFRSAFNKDPDDNRFVFYGIRYIIDNFVSQPWTENDVEMADQFYKTHNAGFQPFPFPRDLFLKFVRENKGFFPVRIEALREGTVANVHVPVYQIFAEGVYSRLITFLETILTQVWYPTTVATLSRRTRDLIEDGFDKSVDQKDHWLIESRLHDFGMRGCTCVEQTILGGCAHLLNFSGSDTMSACFYAQYYLNNGKPVATSIPATEHSVMTSWPNERLAMENMIDKFGGQNKLFAVVMDSYDYNNALTKVLPSISEQHVEKGGMIVLRPDSGDPVECMISALTEGEKCFKTTKNEKGYKVIQGMAAIQGDGINWHTVKAIIDAVTEAGFSAQNVAFGMGGGLLQRVNRDTMSFATKLSYIVYADGTSREVMKRPKTESGKLSLPGVLKVRRDVDGGKLWVEPRGPDEAHDPSTNELQIVYDHGPIEGIWDDFTTIQSRIKSQWKLCPKKFDPISEGMKNRIVGWCKDFDISYEKMMVQIDVDVLEANKKKQEKAASEQDKTASSTPAPAEVTPAPAEPAPVATTEAPQAEAEKPAAAEPEKPADAPAAEAAPEAIVDSAAPSTAEEPAPAEPKAAQEEKTE